MEKTKAELLLIFADNLRIIADNWKEKDAELYRILQCNRGDFHKYKSANRSPNLLFGLRLAHLTGIPLKELVRATASNETSFIGFNSKQHY